MKHLARSIIVATLLAMSWPGGSARADDVNLKRSVRVPASADALRLRDIADLRGELALSLADVIVCTIDDVTSVRELRMHEIRERLESAGAHWGRVNLNGGDVTVRPRLAPDSHPPAAMRPVSLRTDAPEAVGPAAPRRATVAAAEIVHSRTVGGVIAEMLLRALAIDPDDLRLSFDEEDRSVLDARLDLEQAEVDPLGSLRSDRVEIAVRFWSDGRVARREVVTVFPTIRTEIAVPAQDLRRGATILASDVTTRDEWLAPSLAEEHVDSTTAIGRIAGRTLKAGAPLRARDVERESVIRRGDRVVVRCLCGGIVLTLEAEARGEGAVGENVELRKLGERSTFFAVVAGRGEAIVDLRK